MTYWHSVLTKTLVLNITFYNVVCWWIERLCFSKFVFYSCLLHWLGLLFLPTSCPASVCFATWKCCRPMTSDAATCLKVVIVKRVDLSRLPLSTPPIVPKFLWITLHQNHHTNAKYFFIISAKWIFLQLNITVNSSHVTNSPCDEFTGSLLYRASPVPIYPIWLYTGPAQCIAGERIFLDRASPVAIYSCWVVINTESYRRLPKATESYWKIPKDTERHRKLLKVTESTACWIPKATESKPGNIDKLHTSAQCL